MTVSDRYKKRYIEDKVDNDIKALIEAMEVARQKITVLVKRLDTGQADAIELDEFGGLLILLGDLMKAYASTLPSGECDT